MKYSPIVALTLLLLAGCVSSQKDSGNEARSHFAKFGTNKVDYVTEGHGNNTIVLVHCWAGNLGFWRDQVPALRDKARLVLIDLPGHGESDKPHTDYSMDFFADSVLAVMRDAHVSKAILVGHSMGVPVICRVYKQAPQRVLALVAVDGTLRRPKMAPGQAEQFTARFHDPNYRENVRQFMNAMFPVPGTESIRDWVVSQLLETPQYVMLGAMQGMFSSRFPDWDLHHVNVPVLVINAPNPMWTDEYKDYVRSLSSDTEYQTITNTGHWLMLEKPAEFNEVLTGMLQKRDLVKR